jgi:hypothetical protein
VSLPAIPDDYTSVGLEDFSAEDLVMPKLLLAHADGVMKDSLSGETFTEIELVILGLIKQRILWDTEVDDKNKTPLCRSFNHEEGYADAARFPWKAAAPLRLTDYPKTSDGEQVLLPCSVCPLKEWGSNPKGDTPWCSEQYVLAVMLPVPGGGWTPATCTLQRSAVKSVRAYLSAFQRSKSPAFLTITKMSVTAQRRGTVKYVVPSFVRGETTDTADWPQFKDTYFRVRDFLQTPRATVEDDGEATTSTKSEKADDEEIDFD